MWIPSLPTTSNPPLKVGNSQNEKSKQAIWDNKIWGTLPETNMVHLKMKPSKRRFLLETIHFQAQAVSFREGISPFDDGFVREDPIFTD